MESPANVLVLGGAGYLGSVLVSQLLSANFNVTVFDTLLFGDEPLLAASRRPGYELIRGDIRDADLVRSVMRKTDAVIHLAGIVGDGVCDENQKLAIEVNCDATASVIHIAHEVGVSRFIFASSCSVYGNSNGLVDEDSAIKPLSLYAEMKIQSERQLLSSVGDHFVPTVIRLGTLFGLSPRMRFDLVVNHLVGNALSSGLTTILGGDQWRPFLHVEDAARAFVACLSQNTHIVAGEVFNAGSESLNHTIQEVGEAVVRGIPGTEMYIEASKQDGRSYRVSFKRIQASMNFRCKRDLAFGIDEVYRGIQSAKMMPVEPQYHNHIAMRQLIERATPEVQLWHNERKESPFVAKTTRAA